MGEGGLNRPLACKENSARSPLPLLLIMASKPLFLKICCTGHRIGRWFIVVASGVYAGGGGAVCVFVLKVKPSRHVLSSAVLKLTHALLLGLGHTAGTRSAPKGHAI